MNPIYERGRCQIVTSTPQPDTYGSRRGWNHPRRKVSDEDVRAMRWFGATAGQGLTTRAQARYLARTYPLSLSALMDIMSGRSFATVTGPPLSARYWTSPADQQIGLLTWLVWFLWMLRMKVTP